MKYFLPGVVTSEGLKLRAAASMSGTVIDELARGDELDVFTVSTNRRWLDVRVRKTGLHGYVFAEHVKIHKPVPHAPVETVVRPWMLVPLSAWALGAAAVFAVGLYLFGS